MSTKPFYQILAAAARRWHSLSVCYANMAKQNVPHCVGEWNDKSRMLRALSRRTLEEARAAKRLA